MSIVDPTNAGTKKQFKDWIERAIEESKIPNHEKVVLDKRKEKRKRVAKHFGL